MARKEFAYKGKSLDELKSLGTEQLKALLPSRQRRSLLRGLTREHKHLLARLKQKDGLETHCRDMIVLPEMVGRTLKVHDGRNFAVVAIAPEMIGHYLGEFVMTRKKVIHHAPGIGATKSSASLSVK